MNKSPVSQFEPQVRFNWGFHDGTLEASWGKPRRMKHADIFYAAGYEAGYFEFKATKVRAESSEPTWQAFEKARKAA
jgi:hypothetical protein